MRSIFFVVLILSITIEISQGVIFDCEFVTDIGWAVVGYVYTCKATVLTSESGEILEDVRGNHVAAKSNNHVEFLHIGSQDLIFIPKEIEKFFPNLKGIYYQDTNLATISSEDLKPFPQLLVFAVYYGNIVSLPGNLFQHNLNLQCVEFYVNKIEHVGHNLLSGLYQLQYVNFYNNVCVTKYANTLESIRELNQQLPILCPPIEVDECSDQLLLCNNENSELLLEIVNLSKSIEKANERIEELEVESRAKNDQLLLNQEEIENANARIEELEEENRVNNGQLQLCNNENEKANEKIIELEMVIRELLAGTCS